MVFSLFMLPFFPRTSPSFSVRAASLCLTSLSPPYLLVSSPVFCLATRYTHLLHPSLLCLRPLPFQRILGSIAITPEFPLPLPARRTVSLPMPLSLCRRFFLQQLSSLLVTMSPVARASRPQLTSSTIVSKPSFYWLFHLFNKESSPHIFF